MRLALVTTPPSVRSGIGDYTRHLLPLLRERLDVTVFVENGLEGEDYEGLETRAAGSLLPREHDQLLFQLGNELAHGFMAPMVRRLGGVVCLHDWILFDMALAAWPALAKGGVRGHWLALREGGSRELGVYRAVRRERQRANRRVTEGWHAAEPDGRWTADLAHLALPAADPAGERVRVRLRGFPGLAVSFSTVAGASLAQLSFDDAASLHEVEFAHPGLGALAIRTSGAGAARGDPRRLGCFVEEVACGAGRDWRPLDLGAAGPAIQDSNLDRARFDLSLNRSIVRLADGFLVHSKTLGERIVEERNAPTPIGVVHHGAAPRWRDGDRRATRKRLGLDGWEPAFLITSFGAVQQHKRIEVLLEGLARIRAGGLDARLALIGRLEEQHYDPGPTIRRLGLGDVVRTTGHVPEQRAWDLIHAGDLAVQLRGPSTGGTSRGVFQSLSLGRAVIASHAGEQAELPPTCVLPVSPGEREAADLADLVTRLAADPGRLAELEAEARAFVTDECSWERTADRYVEALGLMPSPRAAKKHLLLDRIREGVRERRS